MKRSVMIVILGVVVLGGITLYKPQTIEITNEQKTVEVVVPELQKRLQQAITASSTEIENAMKKASQDAKDNIEKEIEIQVIDKMQLELDAHRETLEKEVSL